MTVSLLISLSILICFLFIILNVLYKRTNYYHNHINNIVEGYLKGVPMGLKVVNLGSTYAKYAFENYKSLQLNGFNFALESHSLYYDRLILEKYANHLNPNCVVVSIVSPCVFLYEGLGIRNQHSIALGIKEFLSTPSLNNILGLFPIINIKKMLHLIHDESSKKDIYEACAVTDNAKECCMRGMASGWTRLFHLSDLKLNEFSMDNQKTMKKNQNELKKIAEFCQKKSLRFVIAVVPFSKMLNQYFSDDFVNVSINKNVRAACGDTIPFLDYRTHEAFQNRSDLFLDGGFRLNKRGSLLFMKILFADLTKRGIIINNATVGTYDI